MKSKGFTLIELAVVLAIIAILAAILTPLVTQYVDEARVTRARADVTTIAGAIALFQRDTGKYPAYATFAATTTDTDILVSAGAQPTDSSTGEWFQNVSTAGFSIQARVNSNFFSLPTTLASANLGRPQYRGPYLAGIDSDPWGYQYVVSAGTLPSTLMGSIVVSAGPDGAINTNRRWGIGANISAAGDDVIARIK